jgi:hypothetical protein
VRVCPLWMTAARAFGLALLAAAIALTACSTRRSSRPNPESTSGTSATAAQRSLASSASTPGSAASDAPAAGLVLGPAGFGPLKLGMTSSQAQQTSIVSGLSDFPGLDSKSPCRGIYLKAVTDHNALTVDGYVSVKYGVVQISAPAGVHTPEGIGIGSTMADVKAAFPGLTTGQGGPVTQVPGNTAALYQFSFDPASHAVTKVSLVAKVQDCSN